MPISNLQSPICVQYIPGSALPYPLSLFLCQPCLACFACLACFLRLPVSRLPSPSSPCTGMCMSTPSWGRLALHDGTYNVLHFSRLLPLVGLPFLTSSPATSASARSPIPIVWSKVHTTSSRCTSLGGCVSLCFSSPRRVAVAEVLPGRTSAGRDIPNHPGL